jgi:hypothetical protein
VGYRLYYGKKAGLYLEHQNVSLEGCNSGTCTASVDLGDGHWYFAVTAYDYDQESDFSNEVVANISVGSLHPVADIKINGEDGPFMEVQDNVEWTLSLDAGEFEGVPYEWWLGMKSHLGMFWWLEGRQLPIFDLSQKILRAGSLPKAQWTFFVYLDENPNRVLDSVVWYDYIFVQIE